jgi:Zn-dependent protease
VNFLALSISDVDWTIVAIGMIVWFVSMGLHEGGHAWMAWRCGDELVKAEGKVTANPFKHIDWQNPMSIILGVVMPFITMITMGFPIGMAWVQVHPGMFRRGHRDHALVSFAGPAADLILAAVALAVGLALWPVLSQRPEQWARLIWLFLFFMYFVSLVYAVFSMIPIPPLDGSRVLYYFGNFRLREFMNKIEPYGWFIYIGLFFVLGAGRLLSPLFEAAQRLYVELPARIWGH